MSSSSSLAEDGRGKLKSRVDAFLHEDASRSQEDQLLFNEINQEEHLSIKTRLFEDESQLSRFLRACDGDCEAAWTELLSCARWYVAERPHRLSCEVCEHHFRQGKNYHNGHDKEGRPVIYMRMARDLPGDDAGKVKIMLYNLERSVRLLEEADSEAESVVWIVDCNGFSYRHHTNISMASEVKEMVAKRYPERLGLLILLDAPWTFRAFWATLSAFLHPTTVNKIKFVQGKDKIASELLELIDEDVLEQCYGGSNMFEYDHEPYFSALVEEDEERGVDPPVVSGKSEV